jgi:hypothetical protein
VPDTLRVLNKPVHWREQNVFLPLFFIPAPVFHEMRKPTSATKLLMTVWALEADKRLRPWVVVFSVL